MSKPPAHSLGVHQGKPVTPVASWTSASEVQPQPGLAVVWIYSKNTVIARGRNTDDSMGLEEREAMVFHQDASEESLCS